MTAADHHDNDAAAMDQAKSRISALVMAAQLNCEMTGAGPAEAVFDLVVAAAVISQRQRPLRPTDAIIGQVVPAAVTTAENWFPIDRRADA